MRMFGFSYDSIDSFYCHPKMYITIRFIASRNHNGNYADLGFNDCDPHLGMDEPDTLRENTLLAMSGVVVNENLTSSSVLFLSHFIGVP